jgi:hypothetical protein
MSFHAKESHRIARDEDTFKEYLGATRCVLDQDSQQPLSKEVTMILGELPNMIVDSDTYNIYSYLTKVRHKYSAPNIPISGSDSFFQRLGNFFKPLLRFICTEEDKQIVRNQVEEWCVEWQLSLDTLDDTVRGYLEIAALAALPVHSIYWGREIRRTYIEGLGVILQASPTITSPLSSPLDDLTDEELRKIIDVYYDYSKSWTLGVRAIRTFLSILYRVLYAYFPRVPLYALLSNSYPKSN